MGIRAVYEDACAHCRSLGTRMEFIKKNEGWKEMVFCYFCGRRKL